MALFQDLNRTGITIVLVTHEPDVARYAGRNLHFRDGRLIKDEPVTDPSDARRILATLPAGGGGGRMNVLAGARIAVRALRVNKLRSALTMLGIVIGVGAVITMVSVGAGAQARVAEQIASLGSNMIVILSGSVTQGGVRIGSGSQLTITEDDAWAIQREIPLVEAAAPSVRGSGQVVYGNLNWGTVLQGVTPEYFTAREWRIVDGRPLTQEDVDGASKVALLGQTVSQNLFGDADPLNQVIRIKKVPFTVVGVLDKKGQNTWGQDQDDVILIPMSTAKNKVIGGSQAKAKSVGAISVRVRDAAMMKDAENEIRDLLRQRHRLQPFQDDDFWLRNLSEVLQSQEAASQVLTMLLAAIASVSLLVGGIGIMNIMLVSVTERTREIGLRMAVGARGRDILTQFLVEAVTLSLIGGAIGIVLGLIGSWAMAYFAEWRVLVSSQSILIAFGFAAAVGIFFGFYPARKAAGLNPIEALEVRVIRRLLVLLILLGGRRGVCPVRADLHAPVRVRPQRVLHHREGRRLARARLRRRPQRDQQRGRARGDRCRGTRREWPRGQPRALLRHGLGSVPRQLAVRDSPVCGGERAAVSRASRVLPVPPNELARGRRQGPLCFVGASHLDPSRRPAACSAVARIIVT